MITVLRPIYAAKTLIKNGILQPAEYCQSTHCDERPDPHQISLLVIHNISLPPNEFGGDYIKYFFTGCLDPNLHPYFASIYHMRVSAHCLIRRDGHILQFVPFDKRAWHAGVSSFQGVTRCNDYAIGVELEGADHIAYTQAQYQSLSNLTKTLMQQYPAITLGRIVGHNDIAPGRKTDPGFAFDWSAYRQMI
ncbi:1,6-anhydro-N-acetylmuramyl-L-alanine amidase AmpD [uncultured Paraglaciecola sp.]|uniref:1,6-anhydro-N-acetylmuramyl-L-alanine amidase AmpD n=1 Tax=uncultured Paraglaciecola sp. TaxID=1765024 RepID=UPI0026142CCA|nr:1,6-anhydro-N-acetylmuramyl-L-alanine amidase AmpD [uncultured Paraglaciecola sp.]